MTARTIWSLPAVLGSAALCLAPSLSQTGPSIVVEHAQVVRKLEMRGNATLSSRLAAVPERVAVWWTSVARQEDLVPIPDQLRSNLRGVQERISAWWAAGARTEPLVYPRGAVKDVTPPAIIGLSITAVAPDSVPAVWETNEYADSRVVCRGEPDVPLQVVDDPYYVLQHKIVLQGLRGRTTYYVRVMSTDRSGNTAASPEQQVYLPSTLRGDVNDDGILSITDVVLALRLCIGLSAPAVKTPFGRPQR
ncbi:MAG: hypothetical protein ACUVRO_07175 [Armatimonadota bacterium]